MREGSSRRSLLRSATLASIGAVIGPRREAARAAPGVVGRPRIKLGQIGTAHGHANKLAVFRRSADYDVVGVVEPDDGLWAAAKDEPAFRGLPRLTEGQLLNTPGLQAVMVESAVRHLVPTARRCVAAGLHVHLDKPAGPDLAAFKALLDLAESKRRVVQLGYMLRYSPATLLLKKLLAAGALGHVFELTGAISKAASPGERRQAAEFPGGMMFELGCHLIDVVVGLLGRPGQVVAFPLESGNAGDRLRDNCLAVFRYPRVTVTIRSTGLEVDGHARRHLVACGTGGTFRAEPLEPPTVRLTLANDAEGFKKGTQDVPLPRYERYVADAADFAAVIRGEKASDYPPPHDLLVHECVLRASGME